MSKFVKEYPCITSLIIVLLASVLAVVLIANSSNKGFEKGYHMEEYIVNDGDTLWSIGKSMIGESADIREWIYEVEKENGISATIYPGQKITVFAHN